MTVKISIYRPQDFWLAAKADFPQLENPIVIQSPSRRAIHDVRSWSAIARAAATVGASIQHGDYKFDVTDWTAIEVAAEGLDETAVRILNAWFSTPSKQPCGDPWRDRPGVGRHRLGYSWRASPAALLPLASNLLRHRKDLEQMPEIEATLIHDARTRRAQVPTTVAARNPQYVGQLEELATLPSSPICLRGIEAPHKMVRTAESAARQPVPPRRQQGAKPQGR